VGLLLSCREVQRDVVRNSHLASDGQPGSYPQLPITANPRDSGLGLPEDSDSPEQRRLQNSERRSMDLSFLRRLGVASKP